MSTWKPKTSKGIAGLCLRVSFGLSLLFVGVNHYKTFAGFSQLTTDGLGILAPLGMVWAYILPGLMIIGGGLFVIGMYRHWAVWASGVALGSIPAGMLLKSAMGPLTLADTMPAAVNAWVWVIVLGLMVKMTSSCCGGSCGTGGGCCSSSDPCACGGVCSCVGGGCGCK